MLCRLAGLRILFGSFDRLACKYFKGRGEEMRTEEVASRPGVSKRFLKHVQSEYLTAICLDGIFLMKFNKNTYGQIIKYCTLELVSKVWWIGTCVSQEVRGAITGG